MQHTRKKQRPAWQSGWVMIVGVLAIAAGFVWWVSRAEPVFTPVEAQVSLNRG